MYNDFTTKSYSIHYTQVWNLFVVLGSPDMVSGFHCASINVFVLSKIIISEELHLGKSEFIWFVTQ